MEMEFVTEFSDKSINRDRAHQIIRGKRTKRQRPSSPFAVSNSDYCSIENSDQSVSEEDEDMANCLIMLARSVSPLKDEKFSDQIRQKTEKLSSRRLTEMMTPLVNGAGGGYVYECKTCNRTFPSFQALGGHRASHKKPKVNVEDKKTISVNTPLPQLTEYSIEEEEHINIVKSPSPSPLNQINSFTVKSKVHECSICGSEFLSGQALGGHMRKHRPIPPSVKLTGIATNSEEITVKSPGESSNMLSLDLNFPPPEDVKSPFQFTASSSSASTQLFSSSPALVDCHY